MYNLTVDIAHTFFVGDGQWLVHNSNCLEVDINTGKTPTTFDRGVENVTMVKGGDTAYENYGEARNLARTHAGLDENDTIDFVQEIGPFQGRVTGRMSSDGKRGWRIDYDPEKGFHVNWWDHTGGSKRSGWNYGAIVVDGGDYNTYLDILQHFPQ